MNELIPTREIALPPADMLGLLKLIELPWQLVAASDGTAVTNFEVWIDGTSTVHTLALRNDGTWTARTFITP